MLCGCSFYCTRLAAEEKVRTRSAHPPPPFPVFATFARLFRVLCLRVYLLLLLKRPVGCSCLLVLGGVLYRVGGCFDRDVIELYIGIECCEQGSRFLSNVFCSATFFSCSTFVHAVRQCSELAFFSLYLFAAIFVSFRLTLLLMIIITQLM